MISLILTFHITSCNQTIPSGFYKFKEEILDCSIESIVNHEQSIIGFYKEKGCKLELDGVRCEREER